MLLIPATAEEIEKNTRGTTIVKSRLRKISPKGLKIMAFSLKTMPKTQPREMDARRIKDEA
jgi:hypothetical protein